ncbi:MAG TPA: ABC transporter ATP-binding protein [Clostridiaceae bacterium]|nr:ABC transporter ATP-binding protein [Clostridiaceae bacterium]
MKTNRKVAVKVNNLVKRYKELVAIDHLSLEIYEGEIFGLLGPNGSGKSTLINSILSLLKYDQGEVEIFGQKMKPTAYNIKQQIGLVPQEPTVYEELTVYGNIDYFCGLYIKDKAERQALVEEAIEFAGLNDFVKFNPSKLSGGLLRRLNLACGIAHKPKLIFLDEPTVAVDPQSRNRILEGVKELRAQGSTIVYTTHYMEEVEILCDRLSILDKGSVLVTGTSAEIIAMSALDENIELEIYGMPNHILQELNDNSDISHLDYQDGRLSIKTKQGGIGLLGILHLFEENSLTPISVSSKKPTLNDVFLEITGKELKDNV